MEHSDLVAEMVHVERLTTQERLHLARHRRLQQLKVWRQREKEWLRHQTRNSSTKRHIYFNDSVMLLEAAARNDIDEGNKTITSLNLKKNFVFFFFFIIFIKMTLNLTKCFVYSTKTFEEGCKS